MTDLTLAMLSLDISSLGKSVDPDKQASQKPADQDLHCFQLCLHLHNN